MQLLSVKHLLISYAVLNNSYRTYKLYFFLLGLVTLTINCIVLKEILRILPSLLVPTFNPSVLVSRLVGISENKMRIVTPKLVKMATDKETICTYKQYQLLHNLSHPSFHNLTIADDLKGKFGRFIQIFSDCTP